MTEHQQRIGGLVHLPALVAELGGVPDLVLAAAGLPPDALSDPEKSLPFATVGQLLAAAVAATGCQHFGLLLGQRLGIASLGLVGELMRHAPDLRQAILDLCVNQPRYVRGSVIYLGVSNDEACWGYGIHLPDFPALEQVGEIAVAAGTNILRELAGLRPARVLIARRAPRDLEPYRLFFGVTPEFSAEQNALIFPTARLAEHVRGADAGRRAVLEKLVSDYWALAEPTTSQKVVRILRARIIMRTATLDAVAADLGLHPRTLNRRLLEEGRSFRSLLNEARFDVARQLLTTTGLRISALGEALGYADPSGFTRAFERWSGMAPSKWQQAAAAE